jgi:hypothetical protein
MLQGNLRDRSMQEFWYKDETELRSFLLTFDCDWNKFSAF